jgi:hypothetical protein
MTSISASITDTNTMAQAQTRSMIKAKNDAYYSCMSEMQQVKHMKKPWTVRYAKAAILGRS